MRNRRQPSCHFWHVSPSQVSLFFRKLADQPANQVCQFMNGACKFSITRRPQNRALTLDVQLFRYFFAKGEIIFRNRKNANESVHKNADTSKVVDSLKKETRRRLQNSNKIQVSFSKSYRVFHNNRAIFSLSDLLKKLSVSSGQDKEGGSFLLDFLLIFPFCFCCSPSAKKQSPKMAKFCEQGSFVTVELLPAG